MDHDDETLLIIGFPEFCARRLVFHLLQVEPRARLVLLCRATDAQSTAAHLGVLGAADRSRVVEIEGDPAWLDFGLSGSEYLRLAESVERVYHFGSVLETSGPDLDCARQNIACAREALAFASAARSLRSLILLSAVTVSGGRTGVIFEHELNKGQSFRGRLQESLATVELMFARRPELPQVILRAAQIVGDSETGEMDRPGLPYRWLVFIDRSPDELVAPVPQRPDATVQIVPVDFVVRAAHYLGARARVGSTRYHLVDPAPPTLREFLHLGAAASGKRLSVNFNASMFTRSLVASPSLSLLSRGARGLLDLFTESPRFDMQNTQAALSGSGIECPPVRSYIGSLLKRARIGFAAHEVEPVDLASARD